MGDTQSTWFSLMHPDWQALLSDQRSLLSELENQLTDAPDLAPEKSLVMAAFESPPESVRVVIIGQDPYPTAGVAIGHAFAAKVGTPIPASLRNIGRELADDLGDSLGPIDLQGWRNQGVLLLNTALTTLHSKPAAHSNLLIQGKPAWQTFTRAAVAVLIETGQPLVLVLWGAHAQSLQRDLAMQLKFHADSVRILQSAHPSPLSAYRGFFGSKPFSKINQALLELGAKPIDWNSNAT